MLRSERHRHSAHRCWRKGIEHSEPCWQPMPTGQITCVILFERSAGDYGSVSSRERERVCTSADVRISFHVDVVLKAMERLWYLFTVQVNQRDTRTTDDADRTSH